MTNLHFENQVVLITGAGRGLGAAYAHLFAERGATVIVHDAGVNRDGSAGDEGPATSVAEAIQTKGGTAFVETQNLSTQSACDALIDNVLTRCGRLDVLVHSAGLVVYKQIAETTDEEWERLRRINIDAPFWLCRAVWPTMKKQQYGRIVLTASMYGLEPYEGSDVTAYGVGKAAQFGLMNSLAGEGKAHGICVNAISPVAATRIYRRQVADDEMMPESVAPGVVLLGSSACPWTGMVLKAAEGMFTLAELSYIETVELGKLPTPEQVLQSLTYRQA